MVRWHVQGYLLAGVAPSEIDEHFNLWPGCAGAYADLFLDVLHRLHAFDYLTNVVIELHNRPLTEKDAERLLLFYGLNLGRYMVDSLVDYLKSPEAIPADVHTLGHERWPRVLLHLQIRSALIARCAPIDDPRLADLDRLSRRLDLLVRHGVDPGSDFHELEIAELIDAEAVKVERSESSISIQQAA